MAPAWSESGPKTVRRYALASRLPDPAVPYSPFLVPASYSIEGEDVSLSGTGLDTAEERHHHESLQSQRQLGPHHPSQVVCLPVEAETDPFQLLVVFQLGLEQPDHLGGQAGRARYRHG